jgi:RNA polymerase sigma factor (sigma-70 family)
MTRQPTATLPSHIRRLAAAGSAMRLPDGECLARFTAGGDEAAFETLVRRHGPAVFRVCRSVLRDAHAAEDAFQATFLVLARRANSLRKQRSLASWLYKVAYRIALRTRQKEILQATRPKAAPLRQVASPLDEISWREVQTIFFEEMARLSERYRAPLLLCCLEGKTRDEAAAQLGCNPGTLKSRLERGRKILRTRLTRRGLALSAGLLGTHLTAAGVEAAVPELAVAAVVRAGRSVRVGGSAGGVVSVRVVSLADEVVRATRFGYLKGLIPLVLICGSLAGGVSLWPRGIAALAPAPADRPADERMADGIAAGPAPARTDLQGDPLPAEAVSRLGSLRLRHGRHVESVHYTPDGKTLVTVGPDGVRTWHVATGKQLHALPMDRKGARVTDAPLTADGKYFLTANDAGIQLWETATARRVSSLGNNKYFTACFSPDGKRVVALTLTTPRMAEAFEVDTGRLLWSVDAGAPRMRDITFTPDGQNVVLDGGEALTLPDNTARFLDAGTGKERRRIDVGASTPDQFVFSPDGSRLLVLCRVGRSLVVNVADGKRLCPVNPPASGVASGPDFFSAAAFAPDGRSFVTAGSGRGLIEWDVATGKELRRIGRVMSGARALTFSPDGKTIAVAGPETTIRLIDRVSGEDRSPGAGNTSQINATAVSTDGKTVVTFGPGPAVLLWDSATGRIKGRPETGESGRWWYLLADDAKTAVASEYEGKAVVVRQLPSGKELARLTLDVPGGRAGLLAISPDGKLLAAKAFASDTLLLFDALSGEVSKRLKDPSFKGCKARFAADGRTLLVYCSDNSAQTWDVAGGSRRHRIRLDLQNFWVPPRSGVAEALYAAGVSPDGALVAAGDMFGHLTMVDAAANNELWRIARPAGSPAVLAFSPDARSLAWGNREEPVIHLMEVATGRERHTFQGHRGPPHTLCISADGTVLVSGSSDTTAMVWDLTGRTAGAKNRDTPLSPEELDASWTALAGNDAAAAYTAGQRLVASGRAVDCLKERLRPVMAADEKALARPLGELDSDRFEVRQRAADELEKLGETVIPACRKVLAGSPSAEVRRRLEALVNKWEQERRTPSGDTLRAIRAVETLERIGTPEARRLLEALAAGLPESRQSREATESVGRLGKRLPTP